jgi:hypothetical protein
MLDLYNFRTAGGRTAMIWRAGAGTYPTDFIPVFGFFRKDSTAGGIFYGCLISEGAPPNASGESDAELNTSLVENRTLASNYDGGRMQLWQAVAAAGGYAPAVRGKQLRSITAVRDTV